MSESKVCGKHFSLEVSEDRLAVMLNIPAGALARAAEITEALASLGVKRYDRAKLTAMLERRGVNALSLEVARGSKPVDELPGTFNFCVPTESADGVPIVVEAGQAIARLVPGTASTAGRDVFGETIPPRPASLPFAKGRGITLADGNVVAAWRGSLRWGGGNLSVEPLLELLGVDDAPVTFDGDVRIKGDVGDGRAVTVGGSLSVAGDVQAARVKVRGAMRVQGGFFGKGRGRCSTSGDIWCQSISGAHVTALGDVRARDEVAQSLIFCSKSVDVAGGRIYGGRIVANGGVTCASEDGAPTVIEIGTDAMVAALLSGMVAEIESHRARAREAREQIEPMMQNTTLLTHQEREKVTEMIAEAGYIDERADVLEKQLDAQVARLRTHERLEIVVRDVVHPGVTVRLAKLEAVVTGALLGPLTLTCATDASTPSILMIDGNGGQPMPLPSCATTPATPAVPATLQRAA